MTNRELAKQLGVSPAAFSLIINRKPGISEQTRQRVIAALEELGFSYLLKPEAEPEEVSTPLPPLVPPMDNGSICFAIYKCNGVVVEHHPFFLLLMESIEIRAKKYGLSVMLRTLDGTADIEEQLDQLNRSGVKGVLIMATEMTEQELALFRKLNVPYVFLDNDFTFDSVNTVSINNQMGTYQAMNFLAEMGHQDIGYVQSSNRISSWDERAYGYAHAAELLGLTLSSEHIYQVRYDEEGSYHDMTELLRTHPSLPSALVFEDDVVAVGVSRALREHGYRVPEDISLVGFNNRPICEMTQPKLTSIDVPKHSFGITGIDALVWLITNETDFSSRTVKYRISTNLVERESVCRI